MFRDKKFLFESPLQFQKGDLLIDASRISRQTAVRSHNTMAGNNNGNLIVSDGSAYGLGLRGV